VISGYRTIQQQQKKKDEQLNQNVPPISQLPVNPLPHVPGAEFAGVVEKIGSHVRTIKKGDRVTIYNRVVDNTCDMCIRGNEMLCRTSGITSVVTNGGFSEYVCIPEEMYLKFHIILIEIHL
jgi:D-arabinose 1-dehydrogenase-like Zn-dependent alcohol dehydrogenase